jgi:hypothetical protein|tara:strand:+ start:34 stop:255 length:222 start_codon:yes stop_codon:yes gene_type:complete
MEVKTENYLLETKYIWFATDGNGNEMATFVTETDAREYAMKYGYSVGYEIDTGYGCVVGQHQDYYISTKENER